MFRNKIFTFALKRSERRREVRPARGLSSDKTEIQFFSESLNLFDSFFGLLILSVSSSFIKKLKLKGC